MKVINDKLILVIGGTGAQGQAVVKALLEPSSDGAPSPYTVRILTRNPDHPKVKAEFNHPNIESVQGSFTDLATVERGLEGAWGAYINTDGSRLLFQRPRTSKTDAQDRPWLLFTVQGAYPDDATLLSTSANPCARGVTS